MYCAQAAARKRTSCGASASHPCASTASHPSRPPPHTLHAGAATARSPSLPPSHPPQKVDAGGRELNSFLPTGLPALQSGVTVLVRRDDSVRKVLHNTLALGVLVYCGMKLRALWTAGELDGVKAALNLA